MISTHQPGTQAVAEVTATRFLSGTILPKVMELR
jgi:hypothetical protein